MQLLYLTYPQWNNKAFIDTVGFGAVGYTGSLYGNYVIFTNPQQIASDFIREKMIFSN